MKTLAFTSKYPGLSNILINDVYISEAFDLPSENIKSNDYKTNIYKAIWDTGATGTVITQKVADECSLKPTGVEEVYTAAGKTKANSYLVNVWLPNKVVITNVKATLGELVGNVGVLIGMNIIGKGDFAVTNKGGKTVFSFRFPSVECIDFVKKPFKQQPTKAIPRRKRSRR